MEKKKIMIIVAAVLCICAIGYFTMNGNKSSESKPKEETVTESSDEKKEDESADEEVTVEINEETSDDYEKIDINEEYEGVIIPAEE